MMNLNTHDVDVLCVYKVLRISNHLQLKLYHCAVIFTVTTLYIFTQILTDALCTIYSIMPSISAYNVEC